MNYKIEQLLQATDVLALETNKLRFSGKVNLVYNPLIYAEEPHRHYILRYANSRKKVLFLGMNPGPWGMAQSGIPFGEISYSKNWLGIKGNILQPKKSHPKRPIEGWSCQRSEVSGKRLWGLMEKYFKTADNFFKDHYVENYCPLVFMEESGRNLTPDKLKASEKNSLIKICDDHLRTVIEIMQPKFLVGIGRYAEKNLLRIVKAITNGNSYSVSSILHPSPANPQANIAWAETVIKQLKEQGIWS